jgi:hypothetical protein
MEAGEWLMRMIDSVEPVNETIERIMAERDVDEDTACRILLDLCESQ